ncbi:MAG: AbrB/MazE/SpoVT family DNA-binding domain-containing protein [Promethearchaeota archaeon]
MMILKKKLGPKGQLLIPKDIRNFIGVKPGETVILEVIDDYIKIRANNLQNKFLDDFMESPRKFKTKKDIKKIIEEQYKF